MHSICIVNKTLQAATGNQEGQSRCSAWSAATNNKKQDAAEAVRDYLAKKSELNNEKAMAKEKAKEKAKAKASRLIGSGTPQEVLGTRGQIAAIGTVSGPAV